MKVIGFNLNKIHAEKKKDFSSKNLDININIKFTDVEKESINILKDNDALKINFKSSLDYKTQEKNNVLAEIVFEGLIVLAAEEQESKDIQEAWKKKEIPISVRTSLNNLILKKCAAKALQFQEDLNLPSHIPIPQIQIQKAQPDQNNKDSQPL